MRRSVLNRWAVAVLLVTRLVLGEFVHAHDGDHHAGGAASEAVAAQSAPCHDDAKQAGEPSEPECCKTGGCECPCLFATAFASGAMLELEPAADPGFTSCASGAPLNQPFTLFRPPAPAPLVA